MRPAESFVSQPIRSLQTMLRVIAKDDRRIPTVVPDGIYGPTTMSAVAAFQRRHGLPVTGVTDQATWDQIVAVYEPALIRVGKAEPVEIIMNPGQVFRPGDHSPYLYLVQSMLIVLSEDHSSIPRPSHTGILDEETAAALTAFQLLSGLEATGYLDKITLKNLSLQFTLNANHQSQKTRIDRPGSRGIIA